MREATEAEYVQAYSRASEHERASTKRTYSVWSKDRKVTSTTYMVNLAYVGERAP